MTDTPLPPSADKASFRQKAKARRLAAAEAAGPDGSVRLCDAFLGALGSWDLAPVAPGGLAPDAVIAAFWPLAGEVDLRPLMAALDEKGFRVALPVVVATDAPLVFRRWEPDTVLVGGGFGTREPGPDAEACTPTCILVPLLAFDREGYRIGYGGGFYDRTLGTLRQQGPLHAIGAAFSGQEIDGVPFEAHDQRLDGVVTEAGVIHIETPWTKRTKDQSE